MIALNRNTFLKNICFDTNKINALLYNVQRAMSDSIKYDATNHVLVFVPESATFNCILSHGLHLEAKTHKDKISLTITSNTNEVLYFDGMTFRDLRAKVIELV